MRLLEAATRATTAPGTPLRLRPPGHRAGTVRLPRLGTGWLLVTSNEHVQATPTDNGRPINGQRCVGVVRAVSRDFELFDFKQASTSFKPARSVRDASAAYAFAHWPVLRVARCWPGQCGVRSAKCEVRTDRDGDGPRPHSPHCESSMRVALRTAVIASVHNLCYLLLVVEL